MRGRGCVPSDTEQAEPYTLIRQVRVPGGVSLATSRQMLYARWADFRLHATTKPLETARRVVMYHAPPRESVLTLAPPVKADSRLTQRQKRRLTVYAIAIALVTVLYIVFPWGTTKTTTERDQKQHLVKIVVEEQNSRSDALILAGLGFAVILALTALLDARLKLTGPGGVGVELQAIALAANATIEPLEEENERLRAALAQARPDLRETVAREDPHVIAARQRWKEVDRRLRGSDWPFAGAQRSDED